MRATSKTHAGLLGASAVLAGALIFAPAFAGSGGGGGGSAGMSGSGSMGSSNAMG